MLHAELDEALAPKTSVTTRRCASSAGCARQSRHQAHPRPRRPAMMQSIISSNFQKALDIQQNGAPAAMDVPESPGPAAMEPAAQPEPAPHPAPTLTPRQAVPPPVVPHLPLGQLVAPPAGAARADGTPEQRPVGDADSDDPLVEFSVGGSRYTSSLSTLSAVPSSAFPVMLAEQGVDAIAYLDRDGPSFRWVLAYLRWVSAGSHPPLALPQDAGERLQLAEEAAFYGLPLLEDCVRRPRISQFELLQLLASTPGGGRMYLAGCDLSALHFPAVSVP